MAEMKVRFRQRYSLAISASYVVLGVIIITRALLALVLPLVILGVVFIALGAVRLRDYLSWRRTAGGS